MQSALPTPYYAVIFTSIRTQNNEGYGKMADHMEELAAKQPGFLGIESFSNAEGLRVSISYWKEEAHLQAWKRVMAHQEAQRLGKEKWYEWYRVEVCKVERTYTWENEE